MKYEVRCCCDPKKLVGSIDIPGQPPKRERDLTFHLYDLQPVVYDAPNTRVATEVVTITIAELRDYDGEKLVSKWAVKDNHLPLEKLLRLPGFVPESDSAS